MEAKHSFTDGCMWEGGGFDVIENCIIDENGGGEMCKHCHTKETKPENGIIHTKWICPRVVVADNEGGHNSTGVCLDCIIEAANTLN